MREKELESAIIQYLQLRGYYAVGIKSGKMLATYKGVTRMIHLAPRGTPDIFCCIKGLFVAIEVKKDRDEMGRWERQWERFQKSRVLVASAEHSIEQHQAGEKVMAAGGIYIPCCDFDEFRTDVMEVEKIADGQKT